MTVKFANMTLTLGQWRNTPGLMVNAGNVKKANQTRRKRRNTGKEKRTKN